MTQAASFHTGRIQELTERIRRSDSNAEREQLARIRAHHVASLQKWGDGAQFSTTPEFELTASTNLLDPTSPSHPSPEYIVADPEVDTRVSGEGGVAANIDSASYDPADYNVGEVKGYVGDDADRARVVLEKERDGENRSTLVSYLEGVIEEADASAEASVEAEASAEASTGPGPDGGEGA